MCATSCSSAAQAAEAAGVAHDNIAIDPGIGFGKSAEENLALIEGAGRLAATGYPVLIGSSRKGFIGRLTGVKEPRPARSGVGLAGGRGGAAGGFHPAGARRCRHPAGPRGLGGDAIKPASMTRSLFGTDGVRGRANASPMTAEIAMRIGMAAGRVFNRGGHRHRVVVGKDTRLSGYMIEQALTAGFLSVGVDVLLLGPLPTPAVGFLTRSMRADVGVMISASHNPYEDNGIKLFGPDGFKLSDAVEMQIERLVESHADIPLAASAAIGRAKRLDDAEGRYIEAVKASVARRLDLTRPQDRRRLRQRRRLQGGADGAVGARRRRDPGRRSSRTASTSTATAARPIPACCRSRW